MQSKASLAKSVSDMSLNGSASAGNLNGGNSQVDVLRTTTGVLTSRPTSRDIKIDSFSMSISGTELIKDCSIELTIGRRYGLLGQNG
jgi:ATP-binding cassette subfamily F protein 2